MHFRSNNSPISKGDTSTVKSMSKVMQQKNLKIIIRTQFVLQIFNGNYLYLDKLIVNLQNDSYFTTTLYTRRQLFLLS